MLCLAFRILAQTPSIPILVSSFLLSPIPPRSSQKCSLSTTTPHHALCILRVHISHLCPPMPSSSTSTEIPPCFLQIISKSFLSQEDVLVLSNPSHLLLQIHFLPSLWGGGWKKPAESIFQVSDTRWNLYPWWDILLKPQESIPLPAYPLLHSSISTALC